MGGSDRNEELKKADDFINPEVKSVKDSPENKRKYKEYNSGDINTLKNEINSVNKAVDVASFYEENINKIYGIDIPGVKEQIEKIEEYKKSITDQRIEIAAANVKMLRIINLFLTQEDVKLKNKTINDEISEIGKIQEDIKAIKDENIKEYFENTFSQVKGINGMVFVCAEISGKIYKEEPKDDSELEIEEYKDNSKLESEEYKDNSKLESEEYKNNREEVNKDIKNIINLFLAKRKEQLKIKEVPTNEKIIKDDSEREKSNEDKYVNDIISYTKAIDDIVQSASTFKQATYYVEKNNNNIKEKIFDIQEKIKKEITSPDNDLSLEQNKIKDKILILVEKYKDECQRIDIFINELTGKINKKDPDYYKSRDDAINLVELRVKSIFLKRAMDGLFDSFSEINFNEISAIRNFDIDKFLEPYNERFEKFIENNNELKEEKEILKKEEAQEDKGDFLGPVSAWVDNIQGKVKTKINESKDDNQEIINIDKALTEIQGDDIAKLLLFEYAEKKGVEQAEKEFISDLENKKYDKLNKFLKSFSEEKDLDNAKTFNDVFGDKLGQEDRDSNKDINKRVGDLNTRIDSLLQKSKEALDKMIDGEEKSKLANDIEQLEKNHSAFKILAELDKDIREHPSKLPFLEDHQALSVNFDMACDNLVKAGLEVILELEVKPVMEKAENVLEGLNKYKGVEKVLEKKRNELIEKSYSSEMRNAKYIGDAKEIDKLSGEISKSAKEFSKLVKDFELLKSAIEDRDPVRFNAELERLEKIYKFSKEDLDIIKKDQPKIKLKSVFEEKNELPKNDVTLIKEELKKFIDEAKFFSRKEKDISNNGERLKQLNELDKSIRDAEGKLNSANIEDLQKFKKEMVDVAVSVRLIDVNQVIDEVNLLEKQKDSFKLTGSAFVTKALEEYKNSIGTNHEEEKFSALEKKLSAVEESYKELRDAVKKSDDVREKEVNPAIDKAEQVLKELGDSRSSSGIKEILEKNLAKFVGEAFSGEMINAKVSGNVPEINRLSEEISKSAKEFSNFLKAFPDFVRDFELLQGIENPNKFGKALINIQDKYKLSDDDVNKIIEQRKFKDEKPKIKLKSVFDNDEVKPVSKGLEVKDEILGVSNQMAEVKSEKPVSSIERSNNDVNTERKFKEKKSASLEEEKSEVSVSLSETKPSSADSKTSSSASKWPPIKEPATQKEMDESRIKAESIKSESKAGLLKSQGATRNVFLPKGPIAPPPEITKNDKDDEKDRKYYDPYNIKIMNKKQPKSKSESESDPDRGFFRRFGKYN